MTTNEHVTVLLKEAVDGLVTNKGGIYVDGTFGRGGHSRELLSRLDQNAKVIAFDKDPRAIESGKLLAGEDARFQIVHESFSEMSKFIASNFDSVDGVLLDLGVSSPQLDEAERGFSFMRDGPLDMRMDSTRGESAAEWLARAKEDDMVRVFKTYGEEKFGKRVARAIVEVREGVLEGYCKEERRITRTSELAKIISDAIPVKEEGKHPATKVFQAIRIFINSELEELRQTLDSLYDLVKPGGRIVIISFHSLEDRMVKRFFRIMESRSDIPSNLPFTADAVRSKLKTVGKAVRASKEEISLNVRSRSAVMRIAERCE